MALESVTSLSPSVGKSPRFWRRRELTPYLFFLPFGLVFLLFFIVPIFYAIYESLFRSQRSGLGLGAPTINFNGLGNYLQIIHDPDFFAGVGRVLLFGIVQVPIMLGLALLLALLLDSTVVRFKPFFRLAFFDSVRYPWYHCCSVVGLSLRSGAEPDR